MTTAYEYPYGDLRQYLEELEKRGLPVRVSRPINKDTELVPLVRLQFRGLPEQDRLAFLFENVTDSQGRRFDASGYEASKGKTIIAVHEDVDPEDLDSVVWAMSFRMRPTRDVTVLPGKLPRLDPSAPEDGSGELSSALLIDATRKRPYPPTSLPAREHMDKALEIWRELGLPELSLANPWHGYELGAWTEENRREAANAVLGRY